MLLDARLYQWYELRQEPRDRELAAEKRERLETQPRDGLLNDAYEQ